MNTHLNDGQKATKMREAATAHSKELPVGAVRSTVEEIAHLPSASLAMLYDAITKEEK